MKRRDVLLASLGILVIWQIAAMIVDRPILPTPVVVLDVFFKELGGELPGHFAASLWRVLAGMLLSVLTAVPAGLAIGGSRSLNRFFSPVIYLALSHPKSGFCANRAALPGHRRPGQDHSHLPDPVLPDRGAGARPGSGPAPAIAAKPAQPGRGTAGAVPLCVPARQPARHFDRAAPVRGHSCSGAVHRRIVRYTQEDLGITSTITAAHCWITLPCTRACWQCQFLGVGVILYGGLDGAKAVSMEVCGVGKRFGKE